MRRDEIDAKRLLLDFTEFLEDRYGIQLVDAREKPHFTEFLEYIVERPVLTRNGTLWQRPLRKTLAQRVTSLSALLRHIHSPFQLSTDSEAMATELQHAYATARKGASAVFERDVRKVAELVGDKEPRHLRFRAILLLVWHVAARPSEIILRRYPDDVHAAFRGFIVIVVPRSKTNPGIRTERFKVNHNADRSMCAVCALHQWIQWLGPDYRGSLFPQLDAKNRVLDRPYSSGNFSKMMAREFLRAGVTKHYTPYSLRKGRATEATSRGVPLEVIQKGLRHTSVAQSVVYIDRDVLLQTMRNVHDESASR